jgi:hypothetical protein
MRERAIWEQLPAGGIRLIKQGHRGRHGDRDGPTNQRS